jgi:hypothetical protein
VNEQPQPTQSIEENLSSIRSDLEYIFIRLNLALDVCTVYYKALNVQNVEQDESVANILRRCGSDKLHEELENLTKIIEELGGTTDYSREERIDEQVTAILKGQGGSVPGDKDLSRLLERPTPYPPLPPEVLVTHVLCTSCDRQ